MSEQADTAEHHTVDGALYLCHTDDHYCPDADRTAADAYAAALNTPPSAEAAAHIRARIEDGSAPRRKVRTRIVTDEGGPQPAEGLRLHLAEAMAKEAGSKAFRESGREWDHMRSVWLAHADAAVNALHRWEAGR